MSSNNTLDYADIILISTHCASILSVVSGVACAVCWLPYKIGGSKDDQPVSLACGHTFCRRCLQSVKQNKSICPKCRTLFSGELCTNYALLEVLEAAAEANAQVSGQYDRLCNMLHRFCTPTCPCVENEQHQQHLVSVWLELQLLLITEHIYILIDKSPYL